MKMSKRQQLDIFKKSLESERSTFIAHWRDLCDYIRPRRGRFFLDDVNRGDRRNQKIIDLTATKASRTLRSGMMSGLTSPARPWFDLKPSDPDYADYPEVKQWLHIVAERMRAVFLNSNFYQQLPTVYGDLGDFASAAMLFEKDFDRVIRTKALPLGSYAISRNFEGRINGFTRELKMTVSQLIEEFGYTDGESRKKGEIDWSKFSEQVKGAYENCNYQQWVSVAHIIRENPNYDKNKFLPKYKKFESVYYEMGMGVADNNETFLRESGYDQFPVLAPAWEIAGEDYYGTDCPGMMALGDIKALQLRHKRSDQALDKTINPAMIAPTAMQSVKSSILPADITYFDESGDKKFRPAHEMNFNFAQLDNSIAAQQFRIKQAYFEDVMLMFAESDRRDITAAEVREKGAEKYVVLGPVLSNCTEDLLDPAVSCAFQFMDELGMIPPAPEVIQNKPLKVEYVSVMHQAQKLVGLGGMKEFFGFIGNLAQYDPRVIRKVNTYEAVNVVADMTSIPPKVLIDDDKAEAAQQQADQMMQQQHQSEMIANAANSANKLGNTPVNEENALGKLLGA